MSKPALSPIGFREILQLKNQTIAPGNIKFKNVTIQSSKYLCVKEDDKKQVAIIDTATKHIMRLPVVVDSAIMNPVSKVVALRASPAPGQNQLQIFNLDMKIKMKAHAMNEEIEFWKWLTPNTIAIVTAKEVLHWSMDGDSVPEKIFERSVVPDQDVQIINYSSSTDGKWLILGGIASDAKTAGVTGVCQIYSVEKKQTQNPIPAHASCFCTVTLDKRTAPSNLFCFTKIAPDASRLHIVEVGVPKESAFNKASALMLQPGDFPVSMLPDNQYGCVYIVTKKGFLFVFEVQSGKCLFGERASDSIMFATVEADPPEGGIMAVDHNGKVMQFFVDKNTVVPYINTVLRDLELGVAMARSYNLPGNEGVFRERFMQLMSQQNYEEAMNLVATSPGGCLRNLETLNALKQIPQGQGLASYFRIMLEKGSLNQIESIELATPVVVKGPAGVARIRDWIKENKLESSEELGDVLKNHDLSIALAIYLRSKSPEKVIGCFLALAAQEASDQDAMGYFEKILEYTKEFNKKTPFSPDYPLLVRQLLSVNMNRARDFATILLRVPPPEGPKLEIGFAADLFFGAGDVKNTVKLLLDYLQPRGDQPEDAELQTRVLEITLLHKPDVANNIMEGDEYKFSHYDRLKIAALCERAQLYQRALEHYKDLVDIKRVLSNTHALSPAFLLEFFGRMTPENCLDCLRDLLKFNLQQNIRLVIEVAKKWSDYLTPEALIALFEEFKNYNGIYFYLANFVNFSTSKTVVFKYIEAAVKLNQIKEVERVCRENDRYDANEVKEFLLQANLKDPRPLIHVCDRFDYVDELTAYLYNNNMQLFIEAYIQRMNSKATPKVIGALLDLNASEEVIKKMLTQVRPPSDMPNFTELLVAEVERRNRLPRILRPWLEERKGENSTDPHVYNGLAKIYVETNNNASHFLSTNKLYDSKVVGAFCETRDPHLAFVCYRRAWGSCDEELIDVTNKNGFFKDQARYLVERQDLPLWAKVLDEANTFRRQLIDQVVATALPESRIPEEVSVAVKAFMAANLPNELIELLERIILHGPQDGDFAQNRNLQNLLILTAIKADKKRVMDYVKRLDNYDGPDIARIAVTEHYKLFEEAVFIYRKFKKGPEAIQVLLENLKDIPRAEEFALAWDQPDVWSILGRAQLAEGLAKQAIASFIKAQDATEYAGVIHAAKLGGHFEELILFLQMARSKTREPVLDNELIYAFARTDRLADLEEFLQTSTLAKVGEVADRCFEEALYQAAKILYNHTNNNAKLAICLVKLEQFQEAVDAARKANNIITWKAVCFSCVDFKKFRLAQICGLNIIVFMDHLSDLVRHYETGANFEELITLLEQGINLDRAHQGIYTQLGICYAKYKEEKLMEHIKLFWSRLNIPTLLGACRQNLHWQEAVLLYKHYDQFDNAVDVVIEHSAECWRHDLFKELLAHISNTEILYRAIDFYVAEHPLLLNELLVDIVNNLDHSRVVGKLRRTNSLPLIMKYLLQVQHDNLPAVNEAINQIYLEEENYKGLRESIDEHDQFDQLQLAMQTRNHHLVEFRRISAHLYKINKRWEESINLSKKDQMWADAMETTSDSGNRDLAESLLTFFVTSGRKECFAACLFTCYELLRPDLVLELAWRNKLMNFAMPFMIQALREFDEKLTQLHEKIDTHETKVVEKEEEAKKKEEELHNSGLNVMPGFHPMMQLALPAPPGSMPGMPGYGMPAGPGFGYGGGY